MHNTTIRQILNVLDTVVLERQADGSYEIWKTPPVWFQALFNQFIYNQNQMAIKDETSFLGNFIVDAEDHWRLGTQGRILWSGLWEEQVEFGGNVLLEAGAVCLEGRDILIIRALFHTGEEYKEALQIAREEIIVADNLAMLGRELEEYSGYLEQEVQKRTQQVRKTLDGIIEAITVITEMRDSYTAGHQKRVADLACAIAEKMGLDLEKIESLRIAGSLHDIGKIYIPAEILCKPGKLTNLEITMLQAHSQAGYDILRNIDFPWPIAEIVLQHHENIDGSGYPQGLSGDDILLKARILRVADVVESMASHRPYRPTLGSKNALEEIALNKGIFYDVDVADTCLQIFKEGSFQFV
jgi:putative nucleotidyltransferase with HDIG domain